ncbi:unnamed protein product [Ambrosiozyma monospora]|uniref:Unnamed protein product n=1 Tax=Ambrosiozyma monospora TaxID=43982 RepID=A0ACB5TBE9_AMBMO|nr:unnamed protein product [Ambrosiozyma monospora]
MYDNGYTESQIMDYLETIYQKIRRERERKEIGYGPFEKKSFRECVEQDSVQRSQDMESGDGRRKEGGVMGEEDSQVRDFVEVDDAFDTSDDEYVFDDDEMGVDKDSLPGALDPSLSHFGYGSSVGTGSYNTDHSSHGSLDSSQGGSALNFNSAILSNYKPATEDPASEGSGTDTEDTTDEFQYRNRKYNKKTALNGVLPASFFRLDKTKTTINKTNKRKPTHSHHPTTTTHHHKRARSEEPIRGVARKKPAPRRPTHSTANELCDFLAPDTLSSEPESEPVRFHDIDVAPSTSQTAIEANLLASRYDALANTAAVSGYDEPEPEPEHEHGPVPVDSNSKLIEIDSGSDDEANSSDSNDEFDDGSDDGLDIRDYDTFKNEMALDMDLDGAAEEDRHAGINYMLSRGSGSGSGSGSGCSKKKKSGSGSKKKSGSKKSKKSQQRKMQGRLGWGVTGRMSLINGSKRTVRGNALPSRGSNGRNSISRSNNVLACSKASKRAVPRATKSGVSQVDMYQAQQAPILLDSSDHEVEVVEVGDAGHGSGGAVSYPVDELDYSNARYDPPTGFADYERLLDHPSTSSCSRESGTPNQKSHTKHKSSGGGPFLSRSSSGLAKSHTRHKSGGPSLSRSTSGLAKSTDTPEEGASSWVPYKLKEMNQHRQHHYSPTSRTQSQIILVQRIQTMYPTTLQISTHQQFPD